MHKIYPWEWIIEDANDLDSIKTIMTEPIWTLLFNSKMILYLLWKKYKNNPILLDTYYSEKVNGLYLEKMLNGLQGNSIRESDGFKIWDSSILQRKIKPIKIDKDILVFNTWIIDNKFNGMGVKSDRKLISDKNHKFIPFSIEY